MYNVVTIDTMGNIVTTIFQDYYTAKEFFNKVNTGYASLNGLWDKDTVQALQFKVC